MLYHGPVRVDRAAQPGKAILLVEFPKGSSFESVPTEIPIELVRGEPLVAP